MIGGMERAHNLTQVWGAAAVGSYLFVLFVFCFCLSFSFHLSAGMKGSGGSSGILPARPEAEGVSGPVIL